MGVSEVLKVVRITVIETLILLILNLKILKLIITFIKFWSSEILQDYWQTNIKYGYASLLPVFKTSLLARLQGVD